MASYQDAPEATRAWPGAGAAAVDLMVPPGVKKEKLSEMIEAAAPAAGVH